MMHTYICHQSFAAHTYHSKHTRKYLNKYTNICRSKYFFATRRFELTCKHSHPCTGRFSSIEPNENDSRGHSESQILYSPRKYFLEEIFSSSNCYGRSNLSFFCANSSNVPNSSKWDT